MSSPTAARPAPTGPAPIVSGFCGSNRHANPDAPYDARYCRRVYTHTTRQWACTCPCHPENPNYGEWPKPKDPARPKTTAKGKRTR